MYVQMRTIYHFIFYLWSTDRVKKWIQRSVQQYETFWNSKVNESVRDAAIWTR